MEAGCMFTESNTVEQMILDAVTQRGGTPASRVREALIRLNPDIATQPDRADEVIYNLRACILSVQADGLVRANENFMAWVRGEKTMPFGPNGEHVPVRLVDTFQPPNNSLIVSTQWTYQAGTADKRFDVLFVVN